MSLWTEDLIAHARRVAATGASASEIAKAISTPERLITRNAVIGAANRGHLTLKGAAKDGARRLMDPIRDGSKNNVNVLAIQKKAKRPTLPLPKITKAPDEPPALGKPGELTSGCRWIHGDVIGGEWVQCGHQTQDGSRYCPHHHARVFRAPEPWRKERAAKHDKNRALLHSLMRAVS